MQGPRHAYLALEEACFDGRATVEEWVAESGQGGAARLQWRCIDHEKRPGSEPVPVNDPDDAGKEEAGRHIAWCNDKS